MTELFKTIIVGYLGIEIFLGLYILVRFQDNSGTVLLLNVLFIFLVCSDFLGSK